MTTYAETETPASRVLYINSKDATAIFGENTSDFDFTLEEPIVVPEHHSIMLSVYSAEIPYSFYNFEEGRNTRIDFQITPFGTPASYDANGFFNVFPAANSQTLIIPSGNYDAPGLADYITQNLKAFVLGPGVVAPILVEYDEVKQKFSFSQSLKGFRTTLGLRNGVASGPGGDDMNEELGFDLQNILGDVYMEQDAASKVWNNGFTNSSGVAGPGTDIIPAEGPYGVQTGILGDDVVDMSNSIRSLFIRTNLSSTSILDSHIGGGFSNILCRVPLNAGPGGTITIEPRNGDVHKLLLKVKAITNIAIRLTNQRNTTINLNGLNFDISLKLDFIAVKDLERPLSLRQLGEQERKKKEESEKDNKLKALDDRLKKLKEKKETKKEKKSKK